MKKISLQMGNTITMRECFDKFIVSCRIKNLSETTIKTYQQHFNVFSLYVDENTYTNDFTKDTYESFILQLESRGTKATTINSYIRSMRVFLYYCMKNLYLESFTIEKIKQDEVIKEAYTDAELEALLKKPNKRKCSFIEYRTYVLINFLVATGQRLGATLELKVTDIDLGNKLVTFKRTKGRKPHIISITDTLSSILEEYIAALPKNIEYLFCNSYGQKSKMKSVEDNISFYNHARGVTKTSAHLFRHTFARNWIQAGGNQFELMRIFDHTTLEMTNHYVNLYSSEVDMNKYDMLDRFNRKHIKIN